MKSPKGNPAVTESLVRAAERKGKWSKHGHALDYQAIATALQVIPPPQIPGAARRLTLPPSWWGAFSLLRQAVYKLSRTPLQWKRVTVALLPRKGEESRPIRLCAIAWRVGAKVINWRVRDWISSWLTPDTPGDARPELLEPDTKSSDKRRQL